MKTTPKDFFLHVGATIALYASAVALIDLAFSAINKALPDALAGYFYPSSIVWPISMLIVLVPALYVIEWLIARDIAKMPEKAVLWVRRWRIYLTLFLAGATIVGDLIALTNTYLNGEIGSRFVWKAVIILVVCGTIFKYYFYSINPTMRWASIVRKATPWFGIVLVAAAIVSGFFAVGSPATQRALRFDDQRVNDLSSIYWQVVGYWQRKGTMPKILSDLQTGAPGMSLPVDPETGASYEYSATTTKPTFELCADFSRPSQDLSGQDSWAHDAGRACFTEVIDTDTYPVYPKEKGTVSQ